MATGDAFWEGVASGEINSMQINTFTPFTSPIDGSTIKSRADLRNHEKQHNVIQVGDAYEKIVNDKREEQREQAASSSD